MESKHEFKKIDTKSCTSYYFNDVVRVKRY